MEYLYTFILGQTYGKLQLGKITNPMEHMGKVEVVA